ncbi:MAG: 23S rRNA (guanosine(2251)-2'-O)-methyltransferase RlmB [Aquificota bacterium]|nr:23S rRNA (guanosine(2251)-2'-O)-methyltransferase RlmB [Aquificota bacterium]
MRRFAVWGRNPVLEALRSGRGLEKIYLAYDTTPPEEILKLAKQRGVKVQRIPRSKVEEIAGTKKTQGVVALVSPVEYVGPEELFREAINRNSFFIVLDHITDPQNVGNLLRTCEVLGGVGALLPKDRASPVNETVVKASSGAVFHLMISKVSGLQKALRSFKGMGGWIVSVEKGGKDIRDVEIPVPCALVLGSEDRGVSRAVLDLSDLVVTIPMWGKVTSLNVGSAGAIAMWETVKGIRR